MGKKQMRERSKINGFVLLVALWIFFTVLSYSRIIVFDGTTVGAAMLLGFVLTCSVLSLVQLLKAMYDKAYPTLAEKDDSS